MVRLKCGSGLTAPNGGLRRHWMSFKPERTGSRKRIYSCVPPPRSFIATAMDLTVVCPTQRHGELVADLASERTRLRKA
jgi:hypothetical protein